MIMSKSCVNDDGYKVNNVNKLKIPVSVPLHRIPRLKVLKHNISATAENSKTDIQKGSECRDTRTSPHNKNTAVEPLELDQDITNENQPIKPKKPRDADLIVGKKIKKFKHTDVEHSKLVSSDVKENISAIKETDKEAATQTDSPETNIELIKCIANYIKTKEQVDDCIETSKKMLTYNFIYKQMKEDFDRAIDIYNAIDKVLKKKTNDTPVAPPKHQIVPVKDADQKQTVCQDPMKQMERITRDVPFTLQKPSAKHPFPCQIIPTKYQHLVGHSQYLYP